MGIFSTIRSRLTRSTAGAVAGVPPVGSGGWTPIVRESYPGAWQQNVTVITLTAALSNPTVFRCVSLIAGDISKTPLQLVTVDDAGIWTPTTSPAFSPVLRKPNRYQTIGQFLEQWMLSKLLWGNTYVLKDRDARGVVVALYVLDPARVVPMVTPDGSVYYSLDTHDIIGIAETITAPASEVIHDRWNCAYHPLVGISPLYACGGAASGANAIQAASSKFFSQGGRPTGMLVAPTEISPDTAARLKEQWKALGAGDTAIVGYGMKYETIDANAVDSQLTEQRDATVATIAGCFGVPVSYVDSTKQPPYANSEATQLQYHAQCLQVHLVSIERVLDEGLELPASYGTEFDLDALIWMDQATRTAAAKDGIAGGALTVNEARRKFYGLGPVEGGDTPYLQQQMFSLAALAERDAAAPFATPPPAPAAAPPTPPAAGPTEEQVAAAVAALAGQ
jgi:HK97 family phage portal protein